MTNDGRVDYTPSGKQVVHGVASSYNNHKCRCRPCKNAWADYIRERVRAWRKKNKVKKSGVKIKF